MKRRQILALGSSSPLLSKILVLRLSTVNFRDWSRPPKQNFPTFWRLASDYDAELRAGAIL